MARRNTSDSVQRFPPLIPNIRPVRVKASADGFPYRHVTRFVICTTAVQTPPCPGPNIRRTEDQGASRLGGGGVRTWTQMCTSGAHNDAVLLLRAGHWEMATNGADCVWRGGVVEVVLWRWWCVEVMVWRGWCGFGGVAAWDDIVEVVVWMCSCGCDCVGVGVYVCVLGGGVAVEVVLWMCVWGGGGCCGGGAVDVCV